MFGSVPNAVLKSMLSKCVPKEEYGKLLSFVVCIELSMPFIFGPLYSGVFIQTAAILPGAVFLVAAAFSTVVLILIGLVSISN